ncbi:MAG TPA: hypothetical protein VE871_00460 [Longimicrobium sp.]|nr:hypothetical protein [Longimicrobium sp.]
MTKRIFSIVAIAALAACGGDDAAEGGEGTVSQDTAVTTVQGTDTVSQPVVVPTTDSVVTTTTVTQDTMQGTAPAGATGTPVADSAAH